LQALKAMIAMVKITKSMLQQYYKDGTVAFMSNKLGMGGA